VISCIASAQTETLVYNRANEDYKLSFTKENISNYDLKRRFYFGPVSLDTRIAKGGNSIGINLGALSYTNSGGADTTSFRVNNFEFNHVSKNGVILKNANFNNDDVDVYYSKEDGRLNQENLKITNSAVNINLNNNDISHNNNVNVNYKSTKINLYDSENKKGSVKGLNINNPNVDIVVQEKNGFNNMKVSSQGNNMAFTEHSYGGVYRYNNPNFSLKYYSHNSRLEYSSDIGKFYLGELSYGYSIGLRFDDLKLTATNWEDAVFHNKINKSYSVQYNNLNLKVDQYRNSYQLQYANKGSRYLIGTEALSYGLNYKTHSISTGLRNDKFDFSYRYKLNNFSFGFSTPDVKKKRNLFMVEYSTKF
jgi:hypothetical protein